MTLRHEFYEHEEISVLSFSMKRIYSPSFTKRGNLESCLKRKEMDKGQPHKGRTKVSLKIL
jgi:hypothetical protein